MLVSRLAWGRILLCVIVGLLLFGRGETASAQPGNPGTYVGAQFCGSCHSEQFSEWAGHGHAWMQVHTGGQTPSADLFAPIGLPLPFGDNGDGTSLPAAVGGWANVVDIVANFKDEETGGVITTDGKFYEGNGAVVNPMPGRCNKCHNTNGSATGTGGAYGSQYPKIQGTWSLNGIQCEQCHGAGPTMNIPDGNICRDCHSSGDSKFRIPFDTTAELFANHHPEGDEYRRSPHKDMGCTGCHDPHLSVWHKEGGVKYADPSSEKSIGMMCTHCHTDIRIRDKMGEIGLVCLDCHMPMDSGAGERHSHIFRINTDPLDSQNNWLTENNDSGKPTKYWKNYDGTTGPGDTFITLDMVCSSCHPKMSLQQMSDAAKYIHREPGLVDVTANGYDKPPALKSTTPVSVSFSVSPTADQLTAKTKADFYVLSQGPRGWSYWNGKKWSSGSKAWVKGQVLSKMSQTPFKGTLAKGTYTYWVKAELADGSEQADSVPIYVTKK